MTRRSLFAVSVWSLVLLLEPSSHGRVLLAAQTAPAPSGAAVQSGSPDNLRVVLLGTGMGPRVSLEQFGPSTRVEAGGVRLLFDCGRGATIRLAQLGVPVASVSRLFLTHLHSDHVVQIPDLLLTGWAGAAISRDKYVDPRLQRTVRQRATTPATHSGCGPPQPSFATDASAASIDSPAADVRGHESFGQLIGMPSRRWTTEHQRTVHHRA
jgi:ribonuclease BN (tRNA processing enzyme)